MRRKEFLSWMALLGVLLVLNLRSTVRGTLSSRHHAPAHRVVEEDDDSGPRRRVEREEDVSSVRTRPPARTQKPLAKSKVYARADEDERPPPELPPRAAVTLPQDEDDSVAAARKRRRRRRPAGDDGLPTDDTDDPNVVARSYGKRTKPLVTEPVDPEAEKLLERQTPAFPAPQREHDCEFINSLFDSVIDAGGEPRSRVITSVVALFSANATRQVADVASMTLHATLGLMMGRPERVVTVTFDRYMHETGKVLHIDNAAKCGGSGYLGDSEAQLYSSGAFDVMVAGTLRHALSLIDRVTSGDLEVRQYFILAQAQVEPGQPLEVDMSELMTKMARAGWFLELAIAELGLGVFRHPKFNPLMTESLSRHRTGARDEERAAEAQVTLAVDDEDPGDGSRRETKPVTEPPVPAVIKDDKDRERYRQLLLRRAEATAADDSDDVRILNSALARLLEKHEAIAELEAEQLQAKRVRRQGGSSRKAKATKEPITTGAPDADDYILDAGAEGQAADAAKKRNQHPEHARGGGDGGEDGNDGLRLGDNHMQVEHGQQARQGKRDAPGGYANAEDAEVLGRQDFLDGQQAADPVAADGEGNQNANDAAAGNEEAGNANNEGAAGAEARSRVLLQLADGRRLIPKERPATLCSEIFADCVGQCTPSLLCGGSEDQEAHNSEKAGLSIFPSSRVNALVFRAAYNTHLPAAPYLLPLAAYGLPHGTESRIVVFGCYPSLIASALLASKGSFHRVKVVSSAKGCDALRNRARGGLRVSVPEAGLDIASDPKLFNFKHEDAIVFTTVRMVNAFPRVIDSVEPGTMVMVLGTSVPMEPLTVRLARLKATGRHHLGVGMTVFHRPPNDAHERED